MSNILTAATVIVMLAFAETGVAQARGNFDRDSHPFAQAQTQDTHPGYAASRELWPWYVPRHGMSASPAEMRSSRPANSERIND